ncbi:MAG: recombinase family protein [Planctomycetia bacterium]|nr:recombinase family protein [Planctomycetia bacterium]
MFPGRLDDTPVGSQFQHRSGKVSKVCVWRLDRLGRTAKGLLTLLEELQALGVGFVSLREGFDLATPAGRLMAGVLASVAAYETEVRKERQLAGIAKAKTEGKRWGGRKTGTRVRLTEEKEDVIRQLHSEGKSVASIARTVGLTRKTVYRALSREFATE